ncbi:unnamed protein product [Mycena citricolor]|uniref:Glycoside hydrolase family 88 protein n=1 Tax=Mycena citricolor TaxID=2018698 RepID=A0AAD2HAZ5_9AGAR|nr:unnamed protein product [Mycena citricolor]
MKKNKWVPLLGIAALLSVNGACCKSKSPRIDVKKYTESAARQTAGLYDKLMATGERKSPQNFQNGVNRYCAYEGWISGFFPWKTRASEQTERLERIKNLTSDHDIGFRMGCSYGNGYRITGDPAYRDVLIQSARSLATRFQPEAGVIMSWNPNKRWKCPVIIDNMMNLELLFNAAIYSGDSSFYKIAVSHADKTLENHYRADHSSFHVVDYDPQTGAVRMKNTAQGYADGSAWARGQAWGLYGFVICYRFTGDEHMIPYWDFDAPNIPDEPRDASAGAIAASALYELALYSDPKYADAADRMLASLSSDSYTAPVGENGNFILMHSVGSKPANSEVDVPIVYADYYYLEAIYRHRQFKKLKKHLWDGRLPALGK